MKEEVKRKSRFAVWINTLRLHTLPLALACIGLGNLLSYKIRFSPIIALFTFLTAILLQILSNLANDYGDAKNGADTPDRIGPERMVHTGEITHRQIKGAIVSVIILSLISGIILLLESLQNIGYTGAMVLFLVGISSIAAAIAYTATKNPYGYRGLGDISVFIFFGIVAVAGSYYLQTGNIPLNIIIPAIGIGLLCTSVLNINNIRDIESDRLAGKNTIPVKIGLRNAKIYHWLLLIVPILLFTCNRNNYSTLDWIIFTIPSLFLIINGIGVSRSKKPADLIPYLKQLVLSIFIFAICYGFLAVYSSNS